MTDVMIGGKSYSLAEVATLEKAGYFNSLGQKHDTSASTPNSIPLVGPLPGNNAMFGVLGAPAGPRAGAWNATPRERTFLSAVPLFKTDVYQELIDVATGINAGSGNNSTSACAVGPKPGALKAARISSMFGILHLSSKIFDITQAGMRRSHSDVTPEFFNNAAVDNPLIPAVPGIDGQDVIASALRTEMMEVGAEIERNAGQVNIAGTQGTEDNTYRGVARQWDGLDRLVRTGWTDVTGVTANGLDAAVTSFNANADGGSDTFSRTVVGATIDTYYGQYDFVTGLGITPEYVLVMRPDLFRAMAQVWSCSYSTTRCLSSQAGTPVNRDAVSIRAEYESILMGRYLPMEGRNVPVILDTSIPRDTLGNGYYKSDIYGLMLRGNGRPTLYGEFFDMGNPQAEEIAAYGGNGSNSSVINNGLYRVFRRETGGCIELDFFARFRMVTDAPFAHFRVDDVFYKSAYNQHDARPGQSYYYNGGLTHRL